MQIVITIDDKDYNDIITDSPRNLNHYERLIVNGTPLSKGHGRLMILSEDKLKENLINSDFSCQKWISEVDLSNTTVTILDADKEN